MRTLLCLVLVSLVKSDEKCCSYIRYHSYRLVIDRVRIFQVATFPSTNTADCQGQCTLRVECSMAYFNQTTCELYRRAWTTEADLRNNAIEPYMIGDLYRKFCQSSNCKPDVMESFDSLSSVSKFLQSGLAPSQERTVEECVMACSEHSSCKVASFDARSRKCFLDTGNPNILTTHGDASQLQFFEKSRAGRSNVERDEGIEGGVPGITDCAFERQIGATVMPGTNVIKRFTAVDMAACQVACEALDRRTCRAYAYDRDSRECRLSSGHYAPRQSAELTSVIASNRKHCVDIDLRCGISDVRVIMRFDQPFNGVIYSVSKPQACRKSFNGTTRLDVVYRAEEQCGFETSTAGFSITLRLQFHTVLMTAHDRNLQLVCEAALQDDRGYEVERTVEMEAKEADTPQIIGAPGEGLVPTARMRIVDASGRQVTSASIGQQLYSEVYINSTQPYGLQVHDCVAAKADGTLVRLTDQEGCPLDGDVFGRFHPVNGNPSIVRAGFQGFSFETQNRLRIDCSVDFCASACKLSTCADDPARFRSKREELGHKSKRLRRSRGQSFVHSDMLMNRYSQPILSEVIELEQRYPLRREFADADAAFSTTDIAMICGCVVGAIIAIGGVTAFLCCARPKMQSN